MTALLELHDHPPLAPLPPLQFVTLLQQHVASNLLNPTEAAIMSGALTFKDKLVRDIATPASRVFYLRSSDILDYETMARVYRR